MNEDEEEGKANEEKEVGFIESKNHVWVIAQNFENEERDIRYENKFFSDTMDQIRTSALS